MNRTSGSSNHLNAPTTGRSDRMMVVMQHATNVHANLAVTSLDVPGACHVISYQSVNFATHINAPMCSTNG